MLFRSNNDLVDQRVGEKIPVGLYDQKYKGWSAEEVYDHLMQNASQKDINDLIKQMIDEHLDAEGEGGALGLPALPSLVRLEVQINDFEQRHR